MPQIAVFAPYLACWRIPCAAIGIVIAFPTRRRSVKAITQSALVCFTRVAGWGLICIIRGPATDEVVAD